MKIQPYYVKLADTYILGPTVSYELGMTQIGLSLIFFEIGLAIDSGKVFAFGCSECNAIGYARVDELPPGWEKRYRPDMTYHFVCGKCRGSVETDDDYLVTDENREQAIDEIMGQLTDRNDDDIYIKALRDYANKLLDESLPFAKYDLASSVAAYADGFGDAWKEYLGGN